MFGAGAEDRIWTRPRDLALAGLVAAAGIAAIAAALIYVVHPLAEAQRALDREQLPTSEEEEILVEPPPLPRAQAVPGWVGTGIAAADPAAAGMR